MSIKPQSQMTFKPGRMSEEAEYALRETYAEINALHHALGMDEGAKPKEQIQDLTLRLDAVESTINEFKAAQLIIEQNITKLQNAIEAVASKLDAENVTNLDKDYLTTVNNQIN